MLPRPSRATRAGSGVPRTPTPSSQASVAGVLRGFRVEQPRQSSGAGDVLLHTRWFHAAVTDTTVLVIGGGFAGVACAQELAKHDVDVACSTRTTTTSSSHCCTRSRQPRLRRTT